MTNITYIDLLRRLYNSMVCVFVCMPVAILGTFIGLILQFGIIAFVVISLGITSKRHEQLIIDNADTLIINIITICFDTPQDFLSDKLYTE